MTPANTSTPSTRDSYEKVQELTQLLTSPHQDIRRQAIKSLGQLGSEAMSALPLLRDALQDSNFVIRLEAAIAVGFIGSKKDTEFLVPLLDDENEAVRFQAISAIAFLCDSKVAPELIKRYEAETPHIRDQILRALGHLRGKEAYALLKRELKADDPTVRTGAVVGLSFYGDVKVCSLLQEIAENDPDDLVAHEARIAVLQLQYGRKLD
ncbi:MAG: HEAT repeat domain-containing protein [Candidatus Hodarchaeota archaeon]